MTVRDSEILGLGLRASTAPVLPLAVSCGDLAATSLAVRSLLSLRALRIARAPHDLNDARSSLARSESLPRRSPLLLVGASLVFSVLASPLLVSLLPLLMPVHLGDHLACTIVRSDAHTNTAPVPHARKLAFRRLFALPAVRSWSSMGSTYDAINRAFPSLLVSFQRIPTRLPLTVHDSVDPSRCHPHVPAH